MATATYLKINETLNSDNYDIVGGDTYLHQAIDETFSTYSDSNYIRNLDSATFASISFRCMGGTFYNKFPKSCGYAKASIYFRARKPTTGESTIVEIFAKKPGGSYVTQIVPIGGSGITTTSFAWYKTALRFQESIHTGSIYDLSYMQIKLEKGAENKKPPPDYVSADRVYISVLGVKAPITYDTLAPSIPTRMRVSGRLLPNDSFSGVSLTPSLSFYYQDSTNATGATYDESKWVRWICGQGKSSGHIISTVFDTGTVSTVASISTWVTINYPSISTTLTTGQNYYFQCQVYDANSNNTYSTILEAQNWNVAQWWENNYTRRYTVSFGATHPTIPKGYTVSVNMNTGVFRAIASNAFIDEGSSDHNSPILRRGNYTYLTWRTGSDKRVYACRYNHINKTTSTLVNVCGIYDGAGNASFDSHYNPVIYIDSQKWIHIVVPGHDTELMHYRSDATNIMSSFSTFATVDIGTYPRLCPDKYGNFLVQYRGIPRRYTKYRYFRANSQTWATPYIYGNYVNKLLPTDGNIYNGGNFIDENDKFHSIVSFNEGYGVSNKPRGYLYAWGYLDTLQGKVATFWSIKGTLLGISATLGDVDESAPSDQIDWGKGGYIFTSYNFTSAFASQGPYYGVNSGQAFNRLPNGTLIVFSGVVPTYGNPYRIGGTPVELVAAIQQAGSTWATYNVSTETGYKYLSRTLAQSIRQYPSYNRIFCYNGVRDDSTGQIELSRFASSDLGQNWSFEFLTSNTNIGANVFFGANPSFIETPELIICRNRFIDFYDGSNPTSNFKVNGDDIRVVYGQTQIPRAAYDYFNFNNTTIEFKLQSTIGKDQQYGDQKHYIYYGNHFSTSTPPANQASIYKLYDGFEGYPAWDTLSSSSYFVRTTSQTGTQSSVLYNLQHHTNKMFQGSKSFRCYGPSVTLAINTPEYYETGFRLDFGARFEAQYNFFKLYALPTTIRPNNYDFSSGVIGDPPTNWNKISGSVELSNSQATVGTRSLKILNAYTTATSYIKSDAVYVGPKTKYTLTYNCYPSISFSAALADAYAYCYIMDGSGATIINGAYTNLTKAWGQKTLTFYTTLSPTVYIGFVMATYAEAGNFAYIDNVRISNPTCEFNLKFELANKLLYDSTSLTGSTQATLASSDVLADKTYYLCKVLNTPTSTRFYLDNKLSAVATYWYGPYNTIGSIYFRGNKGSAGAIAHVDMFVFRDYLNYPTNFLLTEGTIKDFTGDDRLANMVELAYIRYARSANMAFSEKEAINYIANLLILDKTVLEKIVNALVLEKTDLRRFSNILIGEKEVSVRINQILSLDKLLFSRVQNMLDVDKHIVDRMSQIVLQNKEILSRMQNIVFAEKIRIARLNQLINLDKIFIERVGNTLLGDKEILDRLVHEITGDKSLYGYINNMIYSDKLLLMKIHNILISNKSLLDKLANEILTDKTIIDRFSNIAQSTKEFVDRQEQMLELDKIVVDRLCQLIKGEKETLDNIINAVINDKTIIIRLANIILTDKIQTGKITNMLLMNKESIYRLAMRLYGNKELANRIANNMILDTSLVIRIMNSLIMDKSLTGRAASIVYSDKDLRSRIHNLAVFDSFQEKKIAEEVDFNANREARLTEFMTLFITRLINVSQDIELNKTELSVFDETISFDKIILDRGFTEFLDMFAVEVARFSQDAAFMKDFYSNFAESVSLSKDNLDIGFSEIVELAATGLQIFAEDLLFVATKIAAFSQDVNFIAYMEDTLGISQDTELFKNVQIRFTQLLNLSKIKLDRYSQFISLMSTDVLLISEKIDLNKMSAKSFAEYVQFSIEETLTARISSFMGLSKDELTQISGYIELLRITIPDLIFARNFDLKRSISRSHNLKNSDADNMELY